METVAEDDGTQEVQPDFELIAFDFVSNPSTQGAFMHPMTEGIDEKELRTPIECGKYCKVESIVHDIITGV